MKNAKILWVDDEIDLLKPLILFLESKGFILTTINNGNDALDLVRNESFDIILLDENMPGISGLETLTEIKNMRPNLPVVMITKSEEETIMDDAIGSKIADYLIKPVNPNQILLTTKKILEHKRLVSEKTTSNYQAEFGKIGIQINDSFTTSDWIDVYKKLVHWEIQLDQSKGQGMDEVLKMQKNEANNAFFKFVKKNYTKWFESDHQDKPFLSPSIVKQKLYPILEKNEKVVFILLDNLRYDHWQMFKPTIQDVYRVETDELYYSILPTATQYSRNAIFAGLMPSEISKLYPEMWQNNDTETSKNKYEETLLINQLRKLGYKEKFFFEKILNLKAGRKLVENFNHYKNNQFGVVIYNFVDMLSHARTELEMIKELASDESAYRSLTLSWFQHSPLNEFINKCADNGFKVIITTDHGAIRVNNPVKVVGDKNTNTNLRFKFSKNLNYNPKEVFELKDPEKGYLPKENITTSYIFAGNDGFFAYPNNYNYYVNYYKDTFQHGGISMEEMLIPLIVLSPK